MALLSKLKSLLGIGGNADDRQTETTVTVEHDSDDAVDEQVTADPEAEPIVDDPDDSAHGPSDTETASDGVTPDAEVDTPDDADAEVDTPDDADAEVDTPDDADAEAAVDETEAAVQVESESSDDAVDETDGDAETDDADDEAAADAVDDAEESDEAEISINDADIDAAESDAEADAEAPTESDAEATAESDAAGDEEYSDEPLDSIKGIGPAYSERLQGAGIDSIAELAEGDAEEIGDAIDVSPKTVSNWIDRAAEK